MILAAKCAPDEKILSEVCKAGLKAAELYLSKAFLKNISRIAKLCNSMPLCYAVHAPNDCVAIDELVELSTKIHAKIVVFHDIYWEDEWSGITSRFNKSPVILCVENIHSCLEPLKFIRRYDLKRCLDLEHLQMECGGIYEEEFISVMRTSAHIHMTGYKFGSSLWHTHIHHSPEHCIYILGLLKKANYKGFVVSEARISLQTYPEFKNLMEFFSNWKKQNGN